MAKVPRAGPRAPSALTLVRVPFNGDFIEAGVDEAGEIWVVIRRFCEGLGVSTQGQLSKLKGQPWATVKQSFTVAEDGRLRSVATVNLDTLSMWLATIDANRIKEKWRPALIDKQKRAAPVLRRHFFPRLEAADVAPAELPAKAREPPEPPDLAAAVELLGGVDARVRAALRKLPAPRRPSVEHWVDQARELAKLVERSDAPIPADHLACARIASALILGLNAAPDHPLVLGTREDLAKTIALIDRLLAHAASDPELRERITELAGRWAAQASKFRR